MHEPVVKHVLAAIDGAEVDGDSVAELMHAGTVLCGIALLRAEADEREALLAKIDPAIRDYIGQVVARSSPFARLAMSGNGDAR